MNQAERLRDYVRNFALHVGSLEQVAVESGISSADIREFLGGGELANAAALLKWKSETEAIIKEEESRFIWTPTAHKVWAALDQARLPRPGSIRPHERGIALIYGASGTGKTATAEKYLHVHNDKKGFRGHGDIDAIMVCCDGKESRTLSSIYGVILEITGLNQFYPKGSAIKAISQHVRPGGLIIFDEAQSIPLRRMDELRVLPDKYGIGIAFIGNLAGWAGLVASRMAQIMSRSGASRVIIETPNEGDVFAILDAKGITDKAVKNLALQCGMQDGGLRTLAEIIAVAQKAVGNEPITEPVFIAAGETRGVTFEEIKQ